MSVNDYTGSLTYQDIPFLEPGKTRLRMRSKLAGSQKQYENQECTYVGPWSNPPDEYSGIVVKWDNPMWNDNCWFVNRFDEVLPQCHYPDIVWDVKTQGDIWANNAAWEAFPVFLDIQGMPEEDVQLVKEYWRVTGTHTREPFYNYIKQWITVKGL